MEVDEDILTSGPFCDMMMKIKREGEDMDYLVHNIAINLNHIRKAKGMSLDVVAEQTGVSKSMLAAIEKGGQSVHRRARQDHERSAHRALYTC